MRPKFLAILGGLWLCLVIGATVNAAPLQNQSARDYLVNSTQNHWTAQAVYVLGDHLSGDYLRSSACRIDDYAPVSACAGPIMGITALGQDPRTYAAVDLVKNLTDIYETTRADRSITLSEAVFAIIALKAAGEPDSHEIIQNARQFLLNNQNGDGGWAFDIGFASDTDVTAMAMMALLEINTPPFNPAVAAALAFVRQSQNPDGGFHGVWDSGSNANTTAWVISMIYALGQDPERIDWQADGMSPVDYLLSLQTDRGWFEYQLGAGNFLPVDTTAQAVIALSGAFYPVRRIDYVPAVTPAPVSGGGGGGFVPPAVESPITKFPSAEDRQETNNHQDTIINDQTGIECRGDSCDRPAEDEEEFSIYNFQFTINI